MHDRHPKGIRLQALEQNILKYRALEMVLILFYAENLREFVLSAIRSTDRFNGSGTDRLPEGTKKVYEKMWRILITDGIVTKKESDEIEALINLRNDVSHRIHQLTLDVSREPMVRDHAKYLGKKYDYTARKALKKWCAEISERMESKYVMELSFDAFYFEAAEKTYEQELARLDRKIRRQMAARKKEHARLNAEFILDDLGLTGENDPGHPANKTRSGTLSRRGVEICYRLFDADRTPLAIAHLMRISCRAAVKRRRSWAKLGGKRRVRSEIEPLARRSKAGQGPS